MGNGMRRASLFPGFLLITFGLLFLLRDFIPGWSIAHLLVRYWPLLLILWGIAKLLDNVAAQRTGEIRPPTITGGEVTLLAGLLVLVGVVVLANFGREKVHGLDVDSMFGKNTTLTEELPATPIAPHSRIRISTPQGDINIHTASDGNEIRVEANKSMSAFREHDAEQRLRQISVVLTGNSGDYQLHPQFRAGFGENTRVDLDVEVPKQVSLDVQTGRGDVSIAGVSGAVSATSQDGDVEIHDIGGDVSAELQHGDAHLSGTTGNVRLTGRGGEVEIADVKGSASIEGEFFGPINAHNIAGATHFASSRTELSVSQLPGIVESDSGKFTISDIPGNVTLSTRENDISVENVTGRLNIADSKGDIEVHFTQTPKNDVNIANESGAVDLTFPPGANFQISAVSRSGEIQSDFESPSLHLVNNDQVSSLQGDVGGHGPQIRIATSYGTIYLRKGQ